MTAKKPAKAVTKASSSAAPEAHKASALLNGSLQLLEPNAPRGQRLTKAGAVLEVSIISSALVDEAGQMYAIATTERSIQGDTP